VLHHAAGHRQHNAPPPGVASHLQSLGMALVHRPLLANFAEAMAEGRGKARPIRCAKQGETIAQRYTADGGFEEIASGLLRAGDVIYVPCGKYIAGDGEVIEGVASVDESAITGESAPVIRESRRRPLGVTGGTQGSVGLDQVKITSNPGETFLDRMIALVEARRARRRPTRSH